VDNDHLVRLYEKYGRLIFTRCCRLLGDAASAEDATQEVFLRVSAHLDSAPAPASVAVLMWIYRITTNYCLNELRTRKRHPQAADDADLETDGVQSEQLMVNRDLARRLIGRVPERLRAPVWLYHVDGMSHEEVGRTLGISRRTVINYIDEFHDRTRKFLRRAS
jgi:RNA polymerase sigma-70 factor (ECF subfamily)